MVHSMRETMLVSHLFPVSHLFSDIKFVWSHCCPVLCMIVFIVTDSFFCPPHLKSFIILQKNSQMGRRWQPTPVFLPGESHGQRSLVSYCPWGRKESDTTEHTAHTHKSALKMLYQQCLLWFVNNGQQVGTIKCILMSMKLI